ncbi:MAG: hypothetical protein AVDCRST_MAG18-2339, partial [uncultured Thermomicrobiales bacterium]
ARRRADSAIVGHRHHPLSHSGGCRVTSAKCVRCNSALATWLL